MKDITDLLPRVLEKAPNCPEPTAIRHLRDAAIEFCRRTRIWRDRDSFELGPDGCEAVAVEPGIALYEIEHASFAGADLTPVTVKWLNANRQGWRDEQGPPRWLTQSAPDTVRVVPAPEDDGTLALDLILIPSEIADQLPDFLVDQYARVIADGALGALLLLPAEWANPQLAAVHGQAFEAELGRWTDLAPRGQQRAKRRTAMASTF